MPASEELPERPLVAIARYTKFSEAQERGLVAAALDHAYWIDREGDEYVLYVDAVATREIVAELQKFEAERAQRAEDVARRAARPVLKVETFSLYLAGCAMALLFVAQNALPERFTEAGVAHSVRIVAQHEWWRAATALTLHGDISHLAANLAAGLLFAAFVLPQLGTGLAWLAIVLSGSLGNLVNAWFYRASPHLSIGSSTAVFSALGLLVAAECVEQWRHTSTRSWWQLVVPLGAGLGLLAFLGAGDEPHKHTDYMAHLFGFTAGSALGACGAAIRLRERTSRIVQRLAAFAAAALLALAWSCAWRAAR